MLKIIHRGSDLIASLMVLMGFEVAGIGFWSLIRYDSDSAIHPYAMLAFVLVVGFLLVATIIVMMTGADDVLKRGEKFETKLFLFFQTCTIILMTLQVVLLALGSLADNPAAPDAIRLWGWIPLVLFCVFLSWAATLSQGVAEEHSLNKVFMNKSSPLLRFAFMISFAAAPLGLHFEIHPGIWWVLIFLNFALGGILMFDWRKRPHPATEKPAEAVAPPSAEAVEEAQPAAATPA